MADILGPNGQPIQQPFTSQNSGQSSNVDVKGAQKALDDLIKSLGVNHDKSVADRYKAEENFYRTVGNLAKQNQAVLMRYKDDYISAINNRTQAEIDSYKKTASEQKRSSEDVAAFELSTRKKAVSEIEKIEKETAQKIKLEHRKQAFGVTAVQQFGQQMGGVGGAAISGLGGIAGSMLTNPFTFIIGGLVEGAIKVAQENAKNAVTGSQLAGAGFGLGSGAFAGSDFTNSIFGGPASRLGLGISADAAREAVGTAATSRSFIDEARTNRGAAAFTSNLGLFANILPDVGQETKLFTDATKSLGMSQSDLTKTFVTSRVNAEKLKLTQMDTISTQMEMQKALRNITNDGAVATSVLSNISGYLNSIGASQEEKMRIGVAVANGGANLSLAQIIGMSAFNHGGKMPSMASIFGDADGNGGMLGKGGKGVFGLLGGFLEKVSKQTPAGSMQRMMVEEQLTKQFLPGLRLQNLPQAMKLFEEMQTPGAKHNFGAMEKEFQKLEGKTPAVAAAEGINKLLEVVGPGQMLENFLSRFWNEVDHRILEFFGKGPKSIVPQPGFPTTQKDMARIEALQKVS